MTPWLAMRIWFCSREATQSQQLARDRPICNGSFHGEQLAVMHVSCRSAGTRQVCKRDANTDTEMPLLSILRSHPAA